MSASIDCPKIKVKVSKSEIFSEYLVDYIIPITVGLIITGLFSYPFILDLF